MPPRRPLAEEPAHLKALLYGDPDTGKTTALAGMAHLGKVLYVVQEGGLRRRALRQLGIPVENIERTTVTSYEDMQALVWDLRSKFDEDPDHLAGVCIDTLTALEQTFQEQIMRDETAKALRRHVIRDPFLMEGDDWGKNSSQMIRVLRDFRDLPCHVGYASWSKRDVDDDTAEVVYRPMQTPKVATLLLAYCDISVAMQPAWTTDRGAATYWGITRRNGKWLGKDGFGVTPLRMPNPSFDRLVAYVNGDLTAKTDPEVKAFRAVRAGETK